MEIFGILILLTICGAVIFYLDLFDVITNGFKTDWNSLKEKIEDSNVAKENAKKEKHLEATAQAALRQKNRKAEAKNRMQVWKDIRTLSRESQEFDESVNVGHNVTVANSGARYITDVGKLLSSPEVQRQLKAVNRLFMGETLRALKYGKEPPLAVGKGTYNLKTLKRDWNDEWQSVADELGIDLFPKKARVGSPGMSPEAFFARPSPPPNPPKPPPPPNEIISDMGSFKQDMKEFKAEMKKFKAEMKGLRKVSRTGSSGPR